MNVIKHTFKEKIHPSVKLKKRNQKQAMKKEKSVKGASPPPKQHPNRRFHRAERMQTTSRRLA